MKDGISSMRKDNGVHNSTDFFLRNVVDAGRLDVSIEAALKRVRGTQNIADGPVSDQLSDLLDLR